MRRPALACIEVSDIGTRTPGAMPAGIASLAALETLRAFDEACGADACGICGCTDGFACPEGCHWAAPGLCSHCADGHPAAAPAAISLPASLLRI